MSSKEVKDKVESAEVVLFLGPIPTDFNTGKFTYNIKENRLINVHYDHTEVGYANYAKTGMKYLLPKLSERLKEFVGKAGQLTVPEFKNKTVTDTDSIIKHDWLWWRLGMWFKEKDTIVTEAGRCHVDVCVSSILNIIPFL